MKQMDSLETMFVPYKDLLTPKQDIPKPKSSWLWIILVVAVGSVVAYFLFMQPSTKKPLYNLLQSVKEETPVIDLKSISNVVATPPLKDIPKTINLIRGGQKEVYSSPTEFARQVGTAVKETLVTFPQMNAPLVASIVQCAIKSVLGSQKEEKKDPKPEAAVQFSIPVPAIDNSPTVPKEGKFSVAHLPLPIVDDEEVESDAGKKQTKINADSNPYVLKMMKERGFDKKE
jgi:hypothetical protein